jgi:hypothetical protein
MLSRVKSVGSQDRGFPQEAYAAYRAGNTPRQPTSSHSRPYALGPEKTWRSLFSGRSGFPNGKARKSYAGVSHRETNRYRLASAYSLYSSSERKWQWAPVDHVFRQIETALGQFPGIAATGTLPTPHLWQTAGSGFAKFPDTCPCTASHVCLGLPARFSEPSATHSLPCRRGPCPDRLPR